jgi:hypothetical protein
MPDPRRLKVGDQVRFVAIPDEWLRRNRALHRDSLAFMKNMISRKSPSRIWRIDDSGYPWIRARMMYRGKPHYHSWLITESSGWRLVRRRTRPKQA